MELYNMLESQDDLYTKTQAYNFIKKLLEVSKKVTISKQFFSLFFAEYDEARYSIVKTEDTIKSIFIENNLVQLNKTYYKKKQENKTLEAYEISQIGRAHV